MADTLESLEIKVQHNASGADAEINGVATAIGRLKTALTGVPAALKELASAVKTVNDAFKGGTAKYDKFAESMLNVATSAELLGENSSHVMTLANAMNTLTSVKVTAGSFNALAKGVEGVGTAAQTITPEAISNLDKMVTSLAKLQGVDLQGLGSAMSAVNRGGRSATPGTATPLPAEMQEMISTASAIDVLEAKLASLHVAMQEAFNSGDADKAFNLRNQILQTEAALEKARAAAEKAGRATQEAGKGIKEMSKEASKAKSPLDTFVSSLKRIAFYRILRSILKSISQAFQEGLEKAYLFSQGMSGEGNRFAQSLDRMKSATNQMKGQLGSAFISLLAAVEPVLIALINIVTKAADAISQLLAAFTGKTYLKANVTAAKFADTMARGGAAAKEWKNQLLGFDEINRLNEPSKGGGGGGASPLDGFAMTSAPISEFIQRLTQSIKDGDWGSVGDLVSQKVREAIDKAAQKVREFDFTEFAHNLFGGIADYLDGYDIGSVMGSLSELFSNIITGIADFINGSTDTNLIGSISNFISRAIEGVDLQKILSSLAYLITTIVLNVPVIFLRFLSFLSETFASIFSALGFDSVAGFFSGISEKLRNAATWLKENFVDPIVNAVKDLLGIHSPSTVFAGFGEDIVQGMWDGISRKWNEFIGFFEGLWEDLRNWWNGLSLPEFHIPRPRFDWTYSQASGLIAEALKFVGLPATIPHLNISWYAQGGFPEEGQLFFANESGAELVGSMGGRTAVANNDQIVEGIRQGVYDAVLAANNNGNNDVSVRVYLDSREIKAGQQRLNRAWGV